MSSNGCVRRSSLPHSCRNALRKAGIRSRLREGAWPDIGHRDVAAFPNRDGFLDQGRFQIGALSGHERPPDLTDNSLSAKKMAACTRRFQNSSLRLKSIFACRQ